MLFLYVERGWTISLTFFFAYTTLEMVSMESKISFGLSVESSSWSVKNKYNKKFGILWNYIYLCPMKNYMNTVKRRLQVKQGVYDGRYREKVVKDRKKEESKSMCRKNKYNKILVF